MTDERPADRDTEEKILSAARTVFVRRGTAGARMQEIAAEAGVNQALLHYYFRTKERLAEAVFAEAAGRVAPSIARVLASGASIEEKVERFVHIYIDNIRERPFLPGYILSEMHHRPERLRALLNGARIEGTDSAVAIAARVMATLGRQLDELAASGSIRPISPEQFLVNLIALSVFPFVARPALEIVYGLDDEAFGRFLDERRATLPAFILNALRP
ncbi:MAG: TetR family transcriptional regulator [Gemmatimonadaceae bacterium]